MSYNSPATAKNIIGVDVTQEQLDVARSYIDNYTNYRWESTSVIMRFSSNAGFPGRIFLNNPITDFSYLYSVDESTDPETTTELTRFQDYNYDKRTGLLFFFEDYILGYSLTPVLNNFEVSYTYGLTNTDENYNKVLFAEAQISLLIKRNPLVLSDVNLSGDSAKFGDDPIDKILKNAVPKSHRIRGIGGIKKDALINNMWLRKYYENGQWQVY